MIKSALAIWLIILPAYASAENLGCPPQLYSRVEDDPSIVKKPQNDGYYFLFKLAAIGKTNCIDYLLSRGADINALNGETKVTALYAAAEHGQANLVHFLISKGAFVNLGQNGRTPLCAALLRNHEDAAMNLIMAGANLEKINEDNVSALHAAAQGGALEIVKFLLDEGMDINIKSENKFEVTPLQDAAAEGQLEVVKLLVSRKADINYVNKQGNTALDEAQSKKFKEIVDFLRQKGGRSAKAKS